MAVSIQIADAEFTNVIGSLSLPNRVGLIGEFIFGGSEADSIKNRAAPGLPNITPVGSPVFGANYAEIKSGGAYGSVGFNTVLACPEDVTLIVVVKKDVGVPRWLTSTVAYGYNGFANGGSSAVLFNQQGGAPPAIASIASPGHSDFAFFAGVMPQGSYGKVYNYTGGLLSENTATSAGGPRLPGTFVFGQTASSVGVGIARIAYSAIFNRVMSAGEVADAYASLKVFLGTRGCVVS